MNGVNSILDSYAVSPLETKFELLTYTKKLKLGFSVKKHDFLQFLTRFFTKIFSDFSKNVLYDYLRNFFCFLFFFYSFSVLENTKKLSVIKILGNKLRCT